MFENNLIAGVSGQGGGYSIENSLRFNDNDSAYLSRTPSVAGDRKTFTFSAWVKRGNLSGVRQGIFTKTNSAGTAYWAIEFETNDTINVYDSNIGGSTAVFSTTAVFRDVSGWYHIVVAIDTTQATSTNRAKLYINGVQITSFTAVNYPSLNNDTVLNLAEQHSIGSWQPLTGAGLYFDGYLAEINFIDGQALTADDLGQIDETTGEWSPKKYSGTYGTNGFYLPFNGNANDDSGNGNNWTENNLASTDYMIDTPTNNFSTLNPLNDNGSGTQSEGNLKYTQTSATTYTTATSSMQISGKRYWEVYVNGDTAYSLLGILGDGALPSAGGTGANQAGGKSYGYSFNFLRTSLLNNNTAVVTGLNAYNNTDVVSFCFDADTNKFWYAINGVWQQSGDPAAGTNPLITVNDDSYAPCLSSLYSSCVFNFGADSSFAGNKTRQGNTDSNGIGDFYYTPPTGYLALCTDNLAEPTIVDSETQFNVVTYTGDGTSSNAITGVGFQPDFVWIKRRDVVQSHILSNSISGAGFGLSSEATAAEYSIPSEFLSFDSDGFTVGYSSAITNNSGSPYVAWCWKAGGTAVTNTDGSITSQVSANVDAGFSVVGHTGNGVDEATIGHGLSQAPDMIITKNRDSAVDWRVYHSSLPTDYLLRLNLTSAQATNVTNGWIHNVTATTFAANNYSGIAGVNSSGVDYIHYCFHSVEGFSKFGSYTGNGSTDGPFIYTGFRPAFVMTKRTDSTSNWAIVDNERIGYNIDNKMVYPNLTLAESIGGVTMDLLSNGFKPRYGGADYNASGGSYIYMAFAEAPLKNSLGR